MSTLKDTGLFVDVFHNLVNASCFLCDKPLCRMLDAAVFGCIVHFGSLVCLCDSNFRNRWVWLSWVEDRANRREETEGVVF